MTVTTIDDQVSRWLEVRDPLASRRLRTLAELTEAGIPTYAFVGPLLPHFATRPELLDDLFGRLVDAGVRRCSSGYSFVDTPGFSRGRKRTSCGAGQEKPVRRQGGPASASNSRQYAPH
ncbi:hypothetical protein [Streptomyces galilaeus]|uniref:hypothetical protein n=1 Tax=Streptomyces galilaeus TaxID=33899 RepID=UPI00199A4702|nr:hypothetical protein [Streptomyces galilaeus]GGW60820.1 hypothetical protein GCM10010350_51650 [Streptomyces galilaeus]